MKTEQFDEYVRMNLLFGVFAWWLLFGCPPPDGLATRTPSGMCAIHPNSTVT